MVLPLVSSLGTILILPLPLVVGMTAISYLDEHNSLLVYLPASILVLLKSTFHPDTQKELSEMYMEHSSLYVSISPGSPRPEYKSNITANLEYMALWSSHPGSPPFSSCLSPAHPALCRSCKILHDHLPPKLPARDGSAGLAPPWHAGPSLNAAVS